MTLSEIIMSALDQLGRGTDPQLVSKYEGTFKRYANDSVTDLAKVFPMFKTESVALVEGKFTTSDLTSWAVKILSVSQNGEAVEWDKGDETGEFLCMDEYGNELTGSVDVKYKYIPAPMKNVSDKPGVPEQLHQCIVTYVVARDKSTGDPTTQGGAGIYYQLYETQKKQLMNGDMGAPSSYKFINR